MLAFVDLYASLYCSSVRGPFYPSYMPRGWQWPMAYTERLTGNTKVVSSSLVCLPKVCLHLMLRGGLCVLASGYGPWRPIGS